MLLEIDFSSEIPIYTQIRNQIVYCIGTKELKPGDKLPTIRSLANESGINMMTVNKAYQVLKQEGYIIADRRSGAKISPQLPLESELSDKMKVDFRLLFLEAKIKGITMNEIIELCRRTYDEKGGEK